MTNPITVLTELGQSIWYDNIERRLLENGELAAMINRGDIRGVTSNPSIFQKAIADSNDYDPALMPLAWAGWDAEDVFWQLAIEDIRAAADLFAPLYQRTDGGDGYVSLEVSPYIANDTEATVRQAKDLWQRVDKPNLMIKIPATQAGIPAIRQAIAAGINVNVTLIFSIERYQQVMEAYLAGLEDRLASGKMINKIASVASFFISRVDSKVDPQLPENSTLRGKLAIANAKLAYEVFLKTFTSQRFARLQEEGARLQRPLWASTSTKNPAYADTLYVDELIGASTVNTVPPATLDAFRDHGTPAVTLTQNLAAAHQVFADVEAQGVSISAVTNELEAEGVKAFADAFTALLGTLNQRCETANHQLGTLTDGVKRRIAKVTEAEIIERIHAHDPGVWTSDEAEQAEIRVRLGWLRLPKSSVEIIPEIRSLVEQVKSERFTHALVLGMGGSSLAPEVFSQVFEGRLDGLQLSILDSTDPAQVLQKAKTIPVDSTLFVVASKSGGTAEVMAMFEYFWDKTGHNGTQFVAITDPGSSLQAIAQDRKFRACFLADPNVGGRYSALTHFGLLPAALAGVDLERLLKVARRMSKQSKPAARNPGAVLGAIMAEAAVQGRDKLTLIVDEPFLSFGSWIEQLVAESSGKDGKGILPVDLETPGKPSVYGDDRLFVYLRDEGMHDKAVLALQSAGHPVLVINLPDRYVLGAEFYRWEFATAIACAEMGVNAFDQPNVEQAKVLAKKQIALFREHGSLKGPQAGWSDDTVQVFSSTDMKGKSLKAVLAFFIKQAKAGDYIALNAFVPRNAENVARFRALQKSMRDKTKLPVTVGFGPRFLHSTGQYHKGGPNHGLFIVLSVEPDEEVEIPTQGMSFGTLQKAQAIGDVEALLASGRRVLWVHASSSVAELSGKLF